MAKVIAIANQKGGVGKTTTSINLSASLAMNDHAVLLIDMDPQSNATSGVGIDPKTLSRSLYDCLMRGELLSDTVSLTAVSSLWVIPATADLVGAEVELVNVEERESVLKRSLQSLVDRYDYIIIDCPPALGFLTINSLVAAHSV